MMVASSMPPMTSLTISVYVSVLAALAEGKVIHRHVTTLTFVGGLDPWPRFTSMNCPAGTRNVPVSARPFMTQAKSTSFGVWGSIPNATAVRIYACHLPTTGHGLNDAQIVNVRAR